MTFDPHARLLEELRALRVENAELRTANAALMDAAWGVDDSGIRDRMIARVKQSFTDTQLPR